MRRPEYDWTLPKEINDRLGTESYGAQRALCEAGHLLLVLHEAPTRGGNQREHAVFLRKPDGKWLYQGQREGEPALRGLLDGYQGVLADLEGRCAKADTADALLQVLERLIPLSRAAANLKDALQSAREQVREDRLVLALRDQAVEVARGLELLLADARLSLDYRLARSAEDQAQAALQFSRAQHKLNIVAALTFPLMALAAVFGMNLRSGLEGLPGHAFWGVFVAGLWLGVMVKGWIGRQEAPAPPSGNGQKKPARPRR